MNWISFAFPFPSPVCIIRNNKLSGANRSPISLFSQSALPDIDDADILSLRFKPDR